MTVLDDAIERLRSAADQIRAPWFPARWTRVEGPGPDSVTMAGTVTHAGTIPAASFHGLVLHPGCDTVLRCTLDLPEEWAGVPLAGEPLELTINSVYPIAASVDGQPLFMDELPPVANGPAAVTIPGVGPGVTGELELRIRVPGHDLATGMTWLVLHFSTPGLRRRFDRIDLAWAQLTLARAVADGADAHDAEVLERAAALVPQGFDVADGDALDAVLAPVAEALAPFAERVADLELHLVAHSHIDLAWLWTWEDTVEVILRDVRSVVGLLDDHPEMCFTHSQPASYAVVEERDPALFARVQELVRAGRWEVATFQWAEGDLNMASGEATAHQLLHGVRYARDRLGAVPQAFLAPDTFGHPGTTPQLAVDAGASVYYHHRCNPGHQADGLMWPAYHWEGIDGTRILAASTPSYNGEITAFTVVTAILEARDAGLPVALAFYGVGDHGGGPARESLERLRWLGEQVGLPTMRCSTLSGYSTALRSSGAVLPVHRGELNAVFEGCYTTQAEAKRLNRAAENALVTAETLDALSGGGADLAEPWRRLLFQQFHDIFDGSSIGAVYDHTVAELESAVAEAEAVVEASLGALHAHLAAGAIAVTNPLGWDRRDAVVVACSGPPSGAATLVAEDGTRLPAQWTSAGLCFVASVPAFSTVGFRMDDAAPGEWSPMAVGEAPGAADPSRYDRVETDRFIATVRRDCGIITSLLDRESGIELVPFGMRRPADYIDSARADLALHVVQVVNEAPHPMSAWHLDEVVEERSLLSGATASIVEQGPVRVVLQHAHEVGASTVTTRLFLYRELERIDGEATIEWHEAGSPEAGVPGLKVAFTASLDDAEAWFEAPFGAMRRRGDGMEVPAVRWASVGGEGYGISVLNDSRHGHDALGSRLRLTLVRSAYEPAAATDQGRHRVRYSLVPHACGWQQAGIPAQAAGFNVPLIGRTVGAAQAPRRTTAGPWRPHLEGDASVLVSTLKRAEDGEGTVVRLYESAGLAASTSLCGIPARATVVESNIVEDPGKELTVEDGRVVLDLRPWEVKTLIVFR